MQSRDSLKGLPGVAVVVKDGHGTAKDAGFDCYTCRTDVERELRTAGINVLRIESRATPLLRFKLNLSQLRSLPAYRMKYKVSVKVIQGDQSQLNFMETKWPCRAVSGVGTATDVLNHIKKYVDEFVYDWLAVNGTA